MFEILSRILLRLPPERAHKVAVTLLKRYQSFFNCFSVEEKSCFPLKIGDSVWKLPSRLGLAAGFDKNAEVFPALFRLGFGFIEVGTVTPKPQMGNEGQRIWRVSPKGLVNRLGFNNVGLIQFEKNLNHLRKKVPSSILLGNIGKGRDTPEENAIEDYVKLAKGISPYVNGLVINISSPNTKNLRALQNENFLESLSRELKAICPVFIKLAPDLSNEELSNLCDQVRRNDQYHGLVLTNTSRSLAETYGFKEGGYSGEKLLSRSLEAVGIAKEKLKEGKVLVGVGGVQSSDDYRRMRSAGADLVEIYTGFIYQGLGLVEEIKGAE